MANLVKKITQYTVSSSLFKKNSWNTPESHWFISIYQKIIENVAERLSVRYNESNSNKDSSSESREKSDGFYIKSGKLIYSLFTSGVFEVHSSWRVMRAALLFLRKNANEHFFKKLSPKVSFFFRLLKKLMFSFSFYFTSTKNSRYHRDNIIYYNNYNLWLPKRKTFPGVMLSKYFSFQFGIS